MPQPLFKILKTTKKLLKTLQLNKWLMLKKSNKTQLIKFKSMDQSNFHSVFLFLNILLIPQKFKWQKKNCPQSSELEK